MHACGVSNELNSISYIINNQSVSSEIISNVLQDSLLYVYFSLVCSGLTPV